MRGAGQYNGRLGNVDVRQVGTFLAYPNVPAGVWGYTIGGYQVIKKWLSYRELGLLGRPLTPDEAREVMNMARRVAAILLLQPQLDANYYGIKADTYEWPRVSKLA